MFDKDLLRQAIRRIEILEGDLKLTKEKLKEYEISDQGQLITEVKDLRKEINILREGGNL
jgi:hypothetical protein